MKTLVVAFVAIAAIVWLWVRFAGEPLVKAFGWVAIVGGIVYMVWAFAGWMDGDR